MHLIIIPLLIIGAILAFYYFGDIWREVDVSLPGNQENGQEGADFNIRQFLPGRDRENSPLQQLAPSRQQQEE